MMLGGAYSDNAVLICIRVCRLQDQAMELLSKWCLVLRAGSACMRESLRQLKQEICLS